MRTIERRAYAEMYGPTKGDRVRLGDTELLIEVERDTHVRSVDEGLITGRDASDRLGQAVAPCRGRTG